MTQLTKTRRALAIAALVSGTVLAALAAGTGVASAHDFSGGGNCDGWTLQLDGTYSAHTILIDGVAQSTVKTTYVIADDSDDESRTFTVKWDKSSNDVTKTHTLSRNTDGCNPPHDECPGIPGDQPEGYDCEPDVPTTTTTVPDTPPEPPKPPVTPPAPPAPPVPFTPSFTG